MESESRDHQHQAEVCAGTHQSDYTFKEEDVPGLAEALAEVAHKWEEIAVALRLSEAVRAQCREGSSLALKLYRVLYQWVVGQHSNAAQATKENLKIALASPLVQYPRLANELEDNLNMSLNFHTQTTSQKKSLFPKGVTEVLLRQYSQCPEVPQGSWPPVVSETFINLALIETSGRLLMSDYSIQGDADAVLAQKKKVEYKDMFLVYEKGKKLLILGRPGSGKTTLVHKLVRDWSAGRALQGAELVFLVSLRMLNSENDRKLSDILQNFFFDENFLKQVSSAVEEVQGERVCFILDGFDEYCLSNKRKAVVFALLNKSYLANAMIIVTSRPAAACDCVEVFDRSFKKIEVFGFSNSQITEYIKCFPFSSSNDTEDHSTSLQRYLESHPGVLDLCYLPVNCAIVCFIYDTEPDHLPDTQTQIYALFTKLIIIRQLTTKNKSRQLDSLEDLEEQEAKDFKKLCSLAFDMTTQSQQVITTRSPASSDEAPSLGLVTIDITAGLSGYKNSYSFLHLSLQEFLAAYHLSKLDDDQQLSHIEKHATTVYLINMWKFYFGLANFETELNKAKKLFVLNTPDYFEVILFKIQCAYEAQQTSIYQLVSSNTLNFVATILNNYDLSAIACTMSNAATQGSPAIPATILKFVHSSLGHDKLKTFLSQLNDEALGYLELLTFESLTLTIQDLKTLADKLSTKHKEVQGWKGLKSLKHLEMINLSITDEGIAVLAAGLNGNHVLESLDISTNSISTRGISEIMKLDCCLRTLVLAYIDMDDDGAKAIARGLRGNHIMNCLDLKANNIGTDGAEALALAIHENAVNFNFIESLHDKDTSESSSPNLVIKRGYKEIKPCLDKQEPTVALKCWKDGRFVLNSEKLVCQNSSYRINVELIFNCIDVPKVEALLQRINKLRSMSWGCFQNNAIWMKKVKELSSL